MGSTTRGRLAQVKDFVFIKEDILQATKKSLLHLQVQRKGIRYKKRSLRNRKTPKKRYRKKMRFAAYFHNLADLLSQPNGKEL